MCDTISVNITLQNEFDLKTIHLTHLALSGGKRISLLVLATHFVVETVSLSGD